MPSARAATVLTAVQVVLVAVGGVGSVLVLAGLASVPPAPPGSDGFLTGGAYLSLGLIFVVTLGITGVGVALPSVFGAGGLLGFGHFQRRLVQAAAACFDEGLLLGFTVAVTVEFRVGALRLLLAILLGFLLVTIAIGWRLSALVLAVVQNRTEKVG